VAEDKEPNDNPKDDQSPEDEKFVDQDGDVDDGDQEDSSEGAVDESVDDESVDKESQPESSSSEDLFSKYLAQLDKENQAASAFAKKYGIVSPNWAKGMKVGEDMNIVFASPEQQQEFERSVAEHGIKTAE